MSNLQLKSKNPLHNGEILYKSSLRSFEYLAEYGKILKPIKKLFGNFILEQSVNLFPSERGTGKTFLMLGICVAISSCWDNLYGEQIELHGNTLFINHELSEDLIARRIAKMNKNPPGNLKKPKYKTLIYTTRMGFENEIENIIEIMLEYKPVLVVLDNYRMAFLNDDTNSNKDAVKSMIQILKLKDSMKTSILITDHTRKHSRKLLTDSDLQSGSGVKTDLTDADMFLRRSSQNEYYRILKRAKSRMVDEDNKSKLLKFNSDTCWFELLEDNVNEEFSDR